MTVQYFHPTIEGEPTVIPLSVTDVAAPPSTTKGVYFYRHTNLEKLTKSLQAAVDAVPAWSGTVRFVTYVPDGTVYQRHGHVEVAYNFDDDPGISYEIVESSKLMEEALSESKPVGEGVKEAMDIAPYLALGENPNALVFPPFVPGPAVRFKVTKFKCGGIGLGVVFTHYLADAISTQLFLDVWSSAYNDEPIEPIVFAPRDIDNLAFSLDQKDPDVLAQAAKIPRRVYDWWASKDFAPKEFLGACEGPQELIDKEPYGIPIEFGDVDVQDYIFHFSKQEIEGMYKDVANAGVRVSHMNALVAHMWTCIRRARDLDEEATLHMSIGLRNRLPGPVKFSRHVGSLVDRGMAISSFFENNIVENARLIRQTINGYTSELMPSLLHDVAMKVSPIRYFGSNFKNSNTLVTTWVPHNLKQIKFGTFVEVIRCANHANGIIFVNGMNGTKKWYDNGASVSFVASPKVLEKLIADPELRKYKINVDI